MTPVQQPRPGGEPSGRRGTLNHAGQLARGLGWFSLGLGIAQIAAPRALDRMIGVRPDRRSRKAMRLVGVREIAAGIGILTRDRPAGWLWMRTLGDVMDLALLGGALRSRRRRADPKKIAAAASSVIGLAILDTLTGTELSLGTPATSGRTSKQRVEEVEAAITVNGSPGEVYRFWHDVRNLPRFVAGLESVEVVDDRRSRLTAAAPAGLRAGWELEIVDDRPDELIAWRALGKAEVTGSVRFVAAPGGRGTEVHLVLRSLPPGGALGAALAKLVGPALETLVASNLRRFKQVMETGEVVVSDATAHLGPHPARPPAEPVCAPAKEPRTDGRQAVSSSLEGGAR